MATVETVDIAAATPASRPRLRLAGVGLVVFLANAGLLVLQLVAGRLLAPFLGSSLETWTVVIGSFLAGIAAGNAVGGRIADASPRPRKLALFLTLGAVAAGWMVLFPHLLEWTGFHRHLPLGTRIPVLAMLHSFPVAFVLSLLTPLAIRIGLPDVGHTGGVAGLIFALSTLGCLLGNYLTGFVLIPALSIDTITFAVAGLFLLTASGVVVFSMKKGAKPAVIASVVSTPPETMAPIETTVESSTTALPLPLAYCVVFVCSFAGMSLELASTRLMAQVVGVSIYTWTGVIGVMLAGTALGNYLGGRLADYGGRSNRVDSRVMLATCLVFAGGFCVMSLLFFILYTQFQPGYEVGLLGKIVVLTFAFFFLPMAAFGTISPQVIRLATSDVRSAGRIAGRVYAYSTLGAILGTFATGYLIISQVGGFTTVLLCGSLPILAMIIFRQTLRQPLIMYALSAVLGAIFGGFILLFRADIKIAAETNYYTIIVAETHRPVFVAFDPDRHPLAGLVGPSACQEKHKFRNLRLDHLVHSEVDMDDPLYLYYAHEQIQVEMVHEAAVRKPDNQRVLVIGGGGYTFPRAVRTLSPATDVDVVEIDPGVTRIAYERLGLDPKLNIRAYHMDGRQFVVEKAAPESYNVITLDAVNDFSVPAHLMTLEFNHAVKRTLSPDGVYLVTVIDLVGDGELWRSAVHTLRKSFSHVSMLFPEGTFNWKEAEKMPRSVIVLYASERPFDPESLDRATRARTGLRSQVEVVPENVLDRLLAKSARRVLTDQYAPVDNLMSGVFRTRE